MLDAACIISLEERRRLAEVDPCADGPVKQAFAVEKLANAGGVVFVMERSDDAAEGRKRGERV